MYFFFSKIEKLEETSWEKLTTNILKQIIRNWDYGDKNRKKKSTEKSTEKKSQRITNIGLKLNFAYLRFGDGSGTISIQTDTTVSSRGWGRGGGVI